MPDEDGNDAAERRQPLRYEEIEDPEFQKKWLAARHLSWDQVERAFRHGFDSRYRFAERPFYEVDHYLRESWDESAPPAPWEQVADIVRSGYERYQGAGFGVSADEQAEALERFPDRTTGGSTIGGTMGERSFLGSAEPVSDYDGEGGRPVGGEEGNPADPPRPISE